MIDLGHRPLTHHSEPQGHEDERRECRKVLSTASGKHGVRRGQETGMCVWVLGGTGKTRVGACRERDRAEKEQ